MHSNISASEICIHSQIKIHVIAADVLKCSLFYSYTDCNVVSTPTSHNNALVVWPLCANLIYTSHIQYSSFIEHQNCMCSNGVLMHNK